MAKGKFKMFKERLGMVENNLFGKRECYISVPRIVFYMVEHMWHRFGRFSYNSITHSKNIYNIDNCAA
jgi:hypothetical protein